MNNRPYIYEDGTKDWCDEETEGNHPIRNDKNKPAVIYSYREGCVFEYWDGAGISLVVDFSMIIPSVYILK